MHGSSFFAAFFACYISRVYGDVIQNITFDDSDSAFFAWAGNWTAVTPTNPCSPCYDQPNSTRVYNATWHDGNIASDVAGSCSFNGSAIYIYGIDVVQPADVFFILDGNQTSVHTYTGPSLVYNSLFFSATLLSVNYPHMLTWSLARSAIGGTAALLDYAVVTIVVVDETSMIFPSPPSSSATSLSTLPAFSSHFSLPSLASKSSAVSRTLHMRIIIGATIGGVVVLVTLTVIGWMLQQQNPIGSVVNYLIEPFRLHESNPMMPPTIGPGSNSCAPMSKTAPLPPREQVLEERIRELESRIASLPHNAGHPNQVDHNNLEFLPPPY